jgi:cytochrome oxidase Cu insertion factor (SCO1/SenC/PrrC family)
MDAGKKSFLWLVMVFVAPILLGTLLFFNLEKLGFEKGSVNYGVLVQPAFPTQIYDLMQGDTKALREATLAKKWTMLYIEPNVCDKACLDRLLLIKRVRLLMNEHMRRVRTVLVADKKVSASVSKKENPDLVLTHLDMKFSEFLKQYPELDKTPVYLLDPMGNLMMYYPQADPNAKKMIKDLQKLLKYSHLG